jgi:hypothetical protein
MTLFSNSLTAPRTWRISHRVGSSSLVVRATPSLVRMWAPIFMNCATMTSCTIRWRALDEHGRPGDADVAVLGGPPPGSIAGVASP